MPRYEVTGPDGHRYEIEAPEGMSEEDIIADFEQQLGVSAEEENPDFFSLDTARGFAENVAQGATFGFADEISAAIASLASDASYDDALKAIRERQEDFGERRPVTSFLGQAGGTLGTLAATPTLRALTAAPTIGRGAAVGAGTGALYGAGEAEGGAGDIARGAAGGAVLGAGIGAAAVPVARMLGALAETVGNRVSLFRGQKGAEDIAKRKIVEAVMRDYPGLTPRQALLSARDRLTQLGDDATLADIGENTRALLGAMHRLPGEAKTTIQNTIVPRQEGVRGAGEVLEGGQLGRVSDLINRLVPEDFGATRAGLRAGKEAAPLYDAAFKANQQVESKAIDRILRTPDGKKALRHAVRMMQNDRTLVSKKDPELTASLREAIQLGKMGPRARVPREGAGKGLKLRTLDYVKRAFGDIEQREIKAGNRDAARIIGDLRRAFTKELDAADVTARAGPKSFKPEGGAYAQARRLASDKFSNMEALEQGENFMLGREFKYPGDLQAALADMSESQRHYFRVGAAQAIKSKIGGTVARGDVTKKLMDIPALEERTRMAFGDADTFAQYIRGLKAERAKFDTYAEIVGNSKTAARQAAEQEATRVPEALGAAADVAMTGGHAGLAGMARAGARAIGNAARRTALPEPARNEIARMLTQRAAAPLSYSQRLGGPPDPTSFARLLMGGTEAELYR